MHIPTLCEQGFGAKAIRASYLDKNWSLSCLQMPSGWWDGFSCETSFS